MNLEERGNTLPSLTQWRQAMRWWIPLFVAVVMSCGNQSLPPSAHVPEKEEIAAVPEKEGIAAKYPGDVGIEKDPAVILAEDFEGKTLSGWKDIKGFGVEIVLTDKEHMTGKQCVEVHYHPGDDGPWMHRYFPGQERVFVRYYRKWADDWVWPREADHDTVSRRRR